MTAVVFDIGNVLVKWDPYLSFQHAFGSREEVDAFLQRIDFVARNLRADKGETFADLSMELDDPKDQAALAAYVEHFGLGIAELIDGSWVLMDRLRERGHAIHAITNWSAETWPVGARMHPRLGNSFGVTVVSGEEGILKPDAAIFDLLCQRAGVMPQDCVFIDDSPKNVAGAKAAGWDAIHFTGPAALEAALIERGLL